jgi:hypothetical protein
VVYQETHNATPNTYGLFNLSIGQGTPGTGSFGAIDWSAGAYFTQVELNTGSGFQNMGTQQMLSVPYALYAGRAGTVNLSLNDLTDVNTAGVTAGQVLKWDGSQWTPANDAGGGAGDNWGTQVVQTNATLSGNGTSANPLMIAQQGATNGQVLKWNGTTWAPAADNDAQTLSLSGTTLSISGGNNVNLNTVLNNAWQIGGNSGTNPSSHFIGTTDNQPLNFRANDQKAGRIGLAGDGSTFFGFKAGNSDDFSNNGNTFVGFEAGSNNTSGDSNVGVGLLALYSNTTGYQNTASGANAMYSNTSGTFNTANGSGALFFNTTGSSNTATGSGALYSNTNGTGNTAMGRRALLYNTTGNYNTASGYHALYSNTTGNYNTASGYHALYSNTSGSNNTAIGDGAGSYNEANNSCSFFGSDADQSVLTDFTNSTALGNGSRITASNQVRVGNTLVTSIGGYANWTNVSDGRYKKDVQENVPGLDFILRLRPVTYHLDVTGIARFLGEGEFRPKREGREEPQVDETVLALERESRAEKEKILYTGFIAQEVEKTARELGYDFSGVDKPQNEHSLYGLRYAEFVVPLVKAMQEQQRIIEEQDKINKQQQKIIEEQRKELEAQKQFNLSFSQQIHQLKTELDHLKARSLSENR